MRYEDGQIAELRWKETGHNAGLGKYARHTDPAHDRWQIAGQRGFIHPDNVEVIETFVLIPVDGPMRDGPKPTVIFTNHDLLMILQGRELSVAMIGGGEANARLATPIELIDLADRAGRALEAKGLPPGPGLTVADAQRLSRAVGS